MNKQQLKEKLRQDFVVYCEQLGLREIDRPGLYLTKEEIAMIGGKVNKRSRAYGWCHREAQLIFVDTNKRVHHFKTYPYKKTPGKHGRMTYVDFRDTLIHELVHYCWPSMRHGVKFEQRIKEIRNGKRFEVRPIFSM